MSRRSSSPASAASRARSAKTAHAEEEFFSTIAKVVDERKVRSCQQQLIDELAGSLAQRQQVRAAHQNVDERAKALSRKLRSEMKSNQAFENNRFMNLMMMAMMMSNQTTILQRPRLMQASEEAKTMPSEFTPIKILQNLGIPLNDQAAPGLPNAPPAGFSQVAPLD